MTRRYTGLFLLFAIVLSLCGCNEKTDTESVTTEVSGEKDNLDNSANANTDGQENQISDTTEQTQETDVYYEQKGDVFYIRDISFTIPEGFTLNGVDERGTAVSLDETNRSFAICTNMITGVEDQEAIDIYLSQVRVAYGEKIEINNEEINNTTFAIAVVSDDENSIYGKFAIHCKEGHFVYLEYVSLKDDIDDFYELVSSIDLNE